jgi:hypothetical protein
MRMPSTPAEVRAVVLADLRLRYPQTGDGSVQHIADDHDHVVCVAARDRTDQHVVDLLDDLGVLTDRMRDHYRAQRRCYGFADEADARAFVAEDGWEITGRWDLTQSRLFAALHAV